MKFLILQQRENFLKKLLFQICTFVIFEKWLLILDPKAMKSTWLHESSQMYHEK